MRKRRFSRGQGSACASSPLRSRGLAEDKGALCGTRAELIHAEEHKWECRAEGRNQKSSPTFPIPRSTLRCAGASFSAPGGTKRGETRQAAWQLHGKVVTIPKGSRNNIDFSPVQLGSSPGACFWHNGAWSWGGRDFGVMSGEIQRDRSLIIEPITLDGFISGLNFPGTPLARPEGNASAEVSLAPALWIKTYRFGVTPQQLALLTHPSASRKCLPSTC